MVLRTQSSHNVRTLPLQSKGNDQRSTIIGRENSELPLFFDRCFDKNRIKTFIGWLLANFGENATVYVVEKLKNLGFYFATEAGISLSIDDLQVPSNKNWFLSQAEKDIKKNNNNFQCGNLTPVEQSQQLLDRWHRTSETLRESVIQSFRLTNTLNPVYMMAFSGARGNISQVRQLVGMRGLMADPQGQIISFPIRSNFREGLTLTEYVISCYGARKGVVDTALRTADSGYLTRRLVDVSQHVVVWTFDCKTDAGIYLTEMREGKKTILSLKKRILGRVLAQEIPTIAFRNQQISTQLAQQIVSLKEHVLVRSPLSCSVPNSVCQLCYGWSLSRGRIVSLGEAVGVIAAQSIGEPGTQLTMRTFHTGGVFSGDVIDEIRAPHDGVIHFLEPLLGQLIRTSHGKIAYLTRVNGSFVIENNSTERKGLNSDVFGIFAKQKRTELIKSNPILVVPNEHFVSQNVKHTTINLEPGTALFVRQGEKVIAKQLLAEYSSISAQTKERVEAQHQVYSDQKGEIFFDDVVLGKKLKKEEPETEKVSVLNLRNQFKQSESEIFAEQKLDQRSGRKVDIVTSLKLNTLWILSGTFFEPPVSSTLYTKIGDLVDKTTLLTLIQNELNLQTSHLDGEYILSAQLKKNKITKRKEKLLTFFRKSLVSSKLPNILQTRNLEDDIEKKESLFLNKFSLNLVITNIKYKKSGYFFTSCKKEKPYNFYSLFFQVGSATLFDNLINLKTDKENNENNKVSNWNFFFGKTETNFSSGVFLQSKKTKNNYHVTKQEEKSFLRKEIKNLFVLAEPKQRAASSFNFILENRLSKNVLDKQPSKTLSFGFLHFDEVKMLETKDSKIFILKYSKESAKAKDLWYRTKTNLVTLNEKRKVLKRNKSFLTENSIFVPQKLRENRKNVNHFFTTTSLNQPFSNCGEFKNEFVLQWFSPLFKTETGGLIYTNNHYCNKRSVETHIFFIAEANYGKKDLGKMNFGMRKKSFNIVSFKELMAPSICLTNVFLNGKKKPASSFKNSLISFSGDFANILFINKNVKDKYKTKGLSFFAHSNTTHKSRDVHVFSGKTLFSKKQTEENLLGSNRVISINSLLSEIDFLQNKNLNKEFFFLRKKENPSLYSVCFHSAKVETFNSTTNLLKKGFLSFKNKWVETDMPLGYQKNLQGSQIPFYSIENGVLKNNLAPSFFTNQYSSYWGRKKGKRFSGFFLKNFFPLTFKHPLLHIKVKNPNSSTKNTFLVSSLYLNKNRFFGQNDILIKNFNRKPISEKLYQKEFWLVNQQQKRRALEMLTFSKNKETISKFALNFNQVKTNFSERKPSFLYSKEKRRFSLAFLLPKLHLNLSKKKILKFNPFPSKGTYSSSAFIFRINTRAIDLIGGEASKLLRSLDFQKRSSIFYNPYPYSQPIFVEFLQKKSTTNFHGGKAIIVADRDLTKNLNADLDLQDKHAVLQNKTLFSKGSLPLLRRQKNIDLAEIKIDLQNKPKAHIFASYSVPQKGQKQKQENNLKNLKAVEDYKFPQNLISYNDSKSQGIEDALFAKANQGFENASFRQNQKEGIKDVSFAGANLGRENKKFNKFSSFLQKDIKKISTKRYKKTGENVQKSHLQIRPGWLYLPKDQFQTAKAHQSFIAPFQQKIDEIMFDQFPVYIESILRKNFEEQLADKYLQPSINVVDFCKTKTLIEKSQLQKFINKILTVSTKPKESVQSLKVSKQRSNKFLLSLRETFWRGSTFSSFVERDFTTFCDNKKKISKLSDKDSLYQTNLPTNFLNHTKISSISSFLSFLLRNKKERKTKYLQEKSLFSHVGIDVSSETKKKETEKRKQTNSHSLESLPNSLSQKESTEKHIFLNTKQTSSINLTSELLQEENQGIGDASFANANQGLKLKNSLFITKKDKTNDKFIFLQPVSINPIKIVFQVVTNKSCRFNSIQSFTLSCINDINFDFSPNFFVQSQIIDRKLNQNDTHIKNKVNPGFFLCLPQISRIYFVKNKPFSDFILVPRKLNFDQVKIKSHIFSDKKSISYKSENGISKAFLKKNKVFVGEISGETPKNNKNDAVDLQSKSKDRVKNRKQNSAETLTLSERTKSLICSGRQILVSINKKPNKYKNLSKALQGKTFLIQNLSTKVDTDYFSFLVLIPSSLKNTKSASITTSILEHPVPQNVKQVKNAFFDETPSSQKKKPSFSQFFSEKSKLWLLIRKIAEYPLIDTSIFQQKTRLYKGNQTFFEKELIYSSTPLSLYMSNRIIFSSKFNKQKKEELYLSFYHSPKASLKIKENTFYLLNTFSKLEKQLFANLSIDLTKNAFFENKLKLPHNLFSCQNIFWQIFDFHHQNVQKNKLFEGKQPLFRNKIFDTETKDLPRDGVSSQGFGEAFFALDLQSKSKAKQGLDLQSKSTENTFVFAEQKIRNQLLYKIFVQKRTWLFQKENLENIFFLQEKEQTIIRSFKQSYLLHFFLNFNISKQSPLQRIEIKTTFEKMEGSTETSSCAHYLNLQGFSMENLVFAEQKLRTHTSAKNYFTSNLHDLKIRDLNLQNKKPEYLQKDDGQPQFSTFSGWNLNEIDSTEQDFIYFSKKKLLAKKLRILLGKDLNDNFSHKIKEDLLPRNSFFRKQPILRDQKRFGEIELQFPQEKSRFWQYSFTPFARDLSFTLSFTAKLSQSWFFSLANKVKNKTETLPSEGSKMLLRSLAFEKSKPIQGFEYSTFQSKKLLKEGFVSTSKTRLNEKKTKQAYLKNKKLISKQSSSYPLKEKTSYTNLLLDQTITIYDKTPVAITAIMSREEGEIENLKKKSACLILKNSDVEILLTKKEKPLVVVGQLIRYGEQIANGIAAPKSGQIVQVDSNRVTLRKAQPILFPRGGSVDVNHGDYVKEGSPLLSLSYQRLVTGDIVQGIPKIEQLFEARETEGGQPLLSSLHSELEAIFLSYSTQLGLKLAVRESFKEIQQIIVDRVQRVYIAQGVLIADKHFEVVIRQMTSKVRILEGGRPGFLYGELVDLRRVELLNAGVPFANEQAIYEPVILGISKACLEAEGFLSPASFQETTRVLSLAAIERKTDFLRGIKERVILGDVIQAGTGFTLYDRPVRKIKQEECIDLSLSVLHNAHSTLSTSQYYKQL